jgi:hypothetical protein
MSKTKTFKGWVGFVNGKPLVGIARDGYDDANGILDHRSIELFTRKEDAAIRYSDVRRVTVTFEARDDR